MLEDLMPSAVVTVETNRDLVEVELFPEEKESLGDAVEKRRREFITGRACARAALKRLGRVPCAIASGPRGEPLWPPGVTGSITHCRGYRACAVARLVDAASIGIDAEVHEPLPKGVFEEVSSSRERQMLAGHRLGVCMDRLLFSAKEAVYKAWFPLAKTWLGFEDVDLSIGASDTSFRARLLVEGPVVHGERLTDFRGRWRVEGDLVAATVVVPLPGEVSA